MDEMTLPEARAVFADITDRADAELDAAARLLLRCGDWLDCRTASEWMRMRRKEERAQQRGAA